MTTAPNPSQRTARRYRFVDVRTLSPAYFGMVMATGIVLLAARQIGFDRIAWMLFGIAGMAYVILWGLTTLRICRHPRLFLRI